MSSLLTSLSVHEGGSRMDWTRRQDIKEESPETPTALTPDEPDECYFEEDTSIDEGMCVRQVQSYHVQMSY
ncbi:hypothetical protein WN51_13386 [Melipona quadrifasciata]|uniref:Uncharacterized protein n=1 Tax=Melipona quadrifasciata TaxID=166423 RepID=A0A0M9A3G2_9HYME|nr:hypothetical protein WN51_13386 [Melipona quadrifasciata]